MFAIAVICGVLFFLGLGWWKNTYFRRHGVKSPPAYMPFLGHTWNAFIERQHFKDMIKKNYCLFPGEKYIGTLQFTTPMITINDLALIKQVCVKDFDHFADHSTSTSEDDMLFGRSLFALKGQKWRDMRAALSPAFTSSKIRGMCQFMVECGEQLSDYLMKKMSEDENRVRGLLELEMKDLLTRYANDVIATTAFGLKVNSFEEPNNLFYLMGKEGTSFDRKKMIRLFTIVLLPKIAKLFRIMFIPEHITDFFRKIVWDTIRDREERNIVRNDLIQILMEVKKGTLTHDALDGGNEAGFAAVEESAIGKTIVKREWEDDDLVSQAMSFFSAGFDSTSGLICFLMHELALNPEVQTKLQQEIDDVADKIKGRVTYEDLQKMKYMDMVVCETLRYWPPAIATDRRCVKPYTLPPPNEESSEGLQLNVGDGISIPIFGFHRDPKFFEDPDTFDPERFSDENKSDIVPGSFMPFGLGPRNCIGSRFALIEVKAVAYSILLKFDIVTTAKTQHPIQLKKVSLNLDSANGFWLGLRPRC